MPTHYEVLGVRPDADPETIRRAYVALAKANHPDRRQSDDPVARARAEERIRAANAAWHVLRDPARRRGYDRTLSTASAPGPAAPAAKPATGSPPRARGVVGARPAPSGVVVPAEHASLWTFVPVVVVLLLLGAILVVSAYASAGDDAQAPRGGDTRGSTVPGIDDCVLVAAAAEGRVPVPVPCGTTGALRVVAKVDTPRPCPPSLDQLPLSDQKTTLCLGLVP